MAGNLRLLLLAAELLCLDRTSGAMRPVASFIWEVGQGMEAQEVRGRPHGARPSRLAEEIEVRPAHGADEAHATPIGGPNQSSF